MSAVAAALILSASSACGVLGFVNDLVGALLRLVDDFLGLLLGFTETFAYFSLGLLEVLLTALCRGQTLGDARIALFQCGHEWWPYIFHAEPDKHDERDHLSYQCCIEIHIAVLALSSIS